jgi:hypothetical protein
LEPSKRLTLKHYAEHIIEEIQEFQKARTKQKKAEELIDVLHATETLVRKYFLRNSQFCPDTIIRQVKAKNKKRGYYI